VWVTAVPVKSPKDTAAHLHVPARGDYLLSASELFYESYLL